ncbi:MAG TPA: SRPBCC family protein [Roseiflexaceae bacterium]|nr:SRPBCC family protein [Roseiflexaceae bacterium]
MSSTEQSIEVDVPVNTAYNQWTQFEEFPRFMQRIDQVRQLNDTRLLWRATIAGKSKEWSAEIVEQQPDRLISWRSTDGAPNGGTVRFEPIEPRRTRVYLRMEYDPEGIIEWLGDSIGVVERSVRDDLERFKQFIEGRGRETGAWRGEVHDGAVQDQGATARAVGGHSLLDGPPLADEEFDSGGSRGGSSAGMTPAVHGAGAGRSAGGATSPTAPSGGAEVRGVVGGTGSSGATTGGTPGDTSGIGLNPDLARGVRGTDVDPDSAPGSRAAENTTSMGAGARSGGAGASGGTPSRSDAPQDSGTGTMADRESGERLGDAGSTKTD